MVVEYIRYTVPADRSDAFESAYEAAGSALAADEHCLAYEITRCVEQPTSYVVRLEWDSVDGHEQGFRRGANFPPFLEAVKPFIGQIEEMRHYAPALETWRRKS
jgi:quinol monooxygenase YgiN